jgi:hypothetical protein
MQLLHESGFHEPRVQHCNDTKPPPQQQQQQQQQEHFMSKAYPSCLRVCSALCLT